MQQFLVSLPKLVPIDFQQDYVKKMDNIMPCNMYVDYYNVLPLNRSDHSSDCMVPPQPLHGYWRHLKNSFLRRFSGVCIFWLDKENEGQTLLCSIAKDCVHYIIGVYTYIHRSLDLWVVRLRIQNGIILSKYSIPLHTCC